MGRPRAPRMQGAADAGRAKGETVMFGAIDGVLGGFVGVADPVKASTQEAIRELLEPMEDLRRKTEKAQGAVEKLSSHYGEVDMFLLTQPVEIPSKPARVSASRR